jgi:hypothetical protein
MKGTEFDAPAAVVIATCAELAPFEGGTVAVQAF